MAILKILYVSKTFANTPALRDVSFEVAEGEIVCLLGPSGCGKTTLLRIIAGLETPDAGQVLFEGQDLGPVPPHRRDFGLMFQDYALFPHKNVFDNVAFGLRMGGRAEVTEREIEERVREMLALVGLQGFEQRSVNQLSGGEAQRVALARSLAPRPRLLMLDEPLGSLDRALRERLMTELRDILTRVGVTALYVTHDQAEAFAIADRAVVMNAGHVEQIDSPESIYCCPASPFVAHFLGLTNLAEGIVTGRGQVASAWGEIAAVTDDHRAGNQVSVLIRPEAASLAADGASFEWHRDATSTGDRNVIRGRLVARSFRGGRYRVRVQPDTGPPLTFELSVVGALPIKPGDRVAVALDPAGVVLLPPSDNT
jgi:ABC-type Fe3+/spermidine/putrescine transport system ATPase subunit